jgi:hypothetical protein
MLFALGACGKAKQSSFKVEYVGTLNKLPAGIPIGADSGDEPSPVMRALEENMFIHGEMDGKEEEISLHEAFKGYEIANIDYPDPKHIEMEKAGEGRIRYLDALTITLKDESGKAPEIVIEEGSVFDAEKEGDALYLLPPK